jgi:8-oxo-dGTP pyrophosphatase MutT (NUDIX family)
MRLKPHHRLLQRGYMAYSRLARGMTLGVRAMLLKDEHVLLVKHSYVPGWYFPGGGVEPGETVAEAMAREIAEEAGAALTGPAQLFGVYRNETAHKRDHVALFVCREWESPAAPKIPNHEIVALEFFPVSDLPHDATSATRARLREVLLGEPPAANW